MSDVTSPEVVPFWCEAGPERWFGKDESFDLTIGTRFMALHEAAARGELAAWEEARKEPSRLQFCLTSFRETCFAVARMRNPTQSGQ